MRFMKNLTEYISTPTQVGTTRTYSTCHRPSIRGRQLRNQSHLCRIQMKFLKRIKVFSFLLWNCVMEQQSSKQFRAGEKMGEQRAELSYPLNEAAVIPQKTILNVFYLLSPSVTLMLYGTIFEFQFLLFLLIYITLLSIRSLNWKFLNCFYVSCFYEVSTI